MRTRENKINVKYTKWHWNEILHMNFTCVFTIPVKLKIYFLGLLKEIVSGVITDN